MIIALGIFLYRSVVLTKEFQGCFFIQFTEGGVRKDFGRAFVLALFVDDIAILEFCSHNIGMRHAKL